MSHTAKQLTDIAESWLADRYPESVIVRELSVSDLGGASIDIAAITSSHIVGIEIKGAGDSPSRLELQGVKYPLVAREMWLFPAESIFARCHKKRPRAWGALVVAEDGLISVKARARMQPFEQCPRAMCGTLWRDELYYIARVNGMDLGPRATVEPLCQAIINQMPAPAIHDAMIDQLRRRAWKKPVMDLRRRENLQPTQKTKQAGFNF